MTATTGAGGLDLPRNARALLEAVLAISSDLDLHSVLNRIVVAACEITGARYGALGVLDDAGGLSDFLTIGLDEEEHRKIGALPRGHGILGLLIDHPQPLRLAHLQEHPKSFGFPASHPPMESFLGMPVRIRGTVFGNLYLTEKAGGEDFTEQDELLVGALATTAGFVIENARAFARSERRREWLEASAQLSDALQPPILLEEALSRIALAMRTVSGAAIVAVLQRGDHGGHEISAVAGDGAGTGDDVAAVVAALWAQIEQADTQTDLLVVPLEDDRSAVLVPLRAHLASSGVLLVVRAERGVLEIEETELLGSFADQASLFLDRTQAMSERQELVLVSERDRIARDLHDLVIQRLFATGLQLQGARRLSSDEAVVERIDKTVQDLDVTIRDIRSTIFGLQYGHEESLRNDVHDVARDYGPVLGFAPVVRTSGPLDSVVPRPVGDQLVAVLREALSNVARHAGASSTTVEVVVADREVVLRVTDDGRGLAADRMESGLSNVRRRAVELGGAVRLLPEEPHGTMVEWRVPLGPH